MCTVDCSSDTPINEQSTVRTFVQLHRHVLITWWLVWLPARDFWSVCWSTSVKTWLLTGMCRFKICQGRLILGHNLRTHKNRMDFTDTSKFPLFLRTVDKFTDGWQPWRRSRVCVRINWTSGYATMVHGRGCNPHRSSTTLANLETTLLWRHNSETIRDREKRRPPGEHDWTFSCIS